MLLITLLRIMNNSMNCLNSSKNPFPFYFLKYFLIKCNLELIKKCPGIPLTTLSVIPTEISIIFTLEFQQNLHQTQLFISILSNCTRNCQDYRRIPSGNISGTSQGFFSIRTFTRNIFNYCLGRDSPRNFWRDSTK